MNKRYFAELNTDEIIRILICIIAVVCCFFIAIQHEHNNESSAAMLGARPPLVYVNDTLYIISPAGTSYNEYENSFIYLGEIKEYIQPHNLPEKNFQANHEPVGTKIFQHGENIVLLINDKYWLYEKLEDN